MQNTELGNLTIAPVSNTESTTLPLTTPISKEQTPVNNEGLPSSKPNMSLSVNQSSLPTGSIRQPIVKPNRNSITALMDRETEPLNWKTFNYPNMVRIRTIADGSCFFHAIAKAYYTPYQVGMLDGKAIDRQKLIKALRRDLAIKLGQPADPADPDGPTNYDLLSRGKLQEFAKGVPQYSLENMQKELSSTAPVSNSYNEYISNQLNKDIYLLDGETNDVMITGNDDDILYKDRDSIVILYIPGHYELVGIQTEDGIITHFRSTHPFIQAIRNRMAELRINRQIS